ncbi:MAG: 3-methyl-2-oxobutanoate dehydrogenase subunit VorB [Armatimonadota bacterium]|nr:3-methyl-2-oxobutanoate dehydrogenase subunit VorB [Armatimonadota bacterium]
MAERVLMKGNEAIVRGAIAGGCRAFFGYPITPQNEIPECMSRLMPKAGGVFLQAESELAAISMVYGAAAAGVRTMTSSSSPGISLKQEGISYIAGAELPCVIANVQRGGPGLGNIAAAQSDYFQSTRGGGHGDYRTLVLAPWSVMECYTLTAEAFDIADEYRNPCLVLLDAVIGQMIEAIEIPDWKPKVPPKPWTTTGAKGRPANVVNSLYIIPSDLEEVNNRIQARYKHAAEHLTRAQSIRTEDADVVLVAYGCSARVCRSVVDMARGEGIRAGLLRPITLYPFPTREIDALAERGKRFLVVEMSSGQMVEDVRLAVEGKSEVRFYGRTGGVVPAPAEIVEQVKAMAKASSGSTTVNRQPTTVN